MFCGNCGKRVVEQAKFCGNCGTRIPELYSEGSKKSTGNLSKKIKQELASLPLLTLIGDTVQGASGLSSLQEQLKNDANNPLLWMFYYEGFVTYKKIKMGTNAARILYNPVGFAISKGIATGLNAMDDEYEKFDPRKCLSMSLALCMEHVKKGAAESIHLLIIGKTLFYIGINEENRDKREAFFLRSIKYLSLAIKAEKNENYIAEYFFYLSQVYGTTGNAKLQLRALNVSRKMGFKPSLDVLKKELKARGMSEEKLNQMTLNVQRNDIDQFSFTFKMDATARVENSLKFAFKEQGEKLKTTSTRIKNFFS